MGWVGKGGKCARGCGFARTWHATQWCKKCEDGDVHGNKCDTLRALLTAADVEELCLLSGFVTLCICGGMCCVKETSRIHFPCDGGKHMGIPSVRFKKRGGFFSLAEDGRL